MFDDFLDFSTFKEKYPDKTIQDWLIYSKQQTYVQTLSEYQRIKDELSTTEQVEVESELTLMKKEIDKIKK
ncbi:hypothetical protein [Vagococcus salmoninarum]|uniref:hypothetical protein n=1 Tax=Vagococcus salmoninarum TaxID=2739 RepID=UPI0018820C39|nr:hypothetical protein [Vagococcus salmoninarum]MBE9390019.1 hypothetical protein [Vagococcus salmoninarum]